MALTRNFRNPTGYGTQCDAEFDRWMEAVNNVIRLRCLLNADDLPDWSYREAFDEGWSPSDAAHEAVENAHQT